MEAVFRRQRLVIAACLAIVTVAAWAYLLDMAADMSAAMAEMAGMPGMADIPGMAIAPPWAASDLFFLFVMWAVMMVAMMLPTTAPMVMAFMSLNQRRLQNARPFVPTYIFVAGYITVWTAYSAIAALTQWTLHGFALISSGMALSSPWLQGSLLVAAGIFQWTPLKRACLFNCRSPLSFLISSWKEGRRGAFVMGLRHGSYCVGCCWILMALLFVAGVMNLPIVALLTAFVLIEKLIPKGEWVGKATGAVLIFGGLIFFRNAW